MLSFNLECLQHINISQHIIPNPPHNEDWETEFSWENKFIVELFHVASRIL